MSTVPSRWQKLGTYPPALWICTMILGLASAFTYLHTFANGFFYVDDEQFITQNIVVTGGAPALHSFFPAANAPFLVYIPLTMLSWRLTWMLGGGSPVLFHLIDLLLHIGCAALVCWIIDRLTGKRWAALLAGLAFAVHPLNAEAVVWATQRKDILSSLFALLSFAAYIRHVEDEDRRMWLVASIIAYVLGLLTKVGIVPLPVAFLLFDWVAGRKNAMKLLIEKTWFVLVAIPIVMLNLHVGQSFVGAVSTQTILLLGAQSVATLLGLAIVPWHLSLLRWHPNPAELSDPSILLSLAIVAIFCAITVWLLVRGGRARLAGFGCAWFLLFLLPTFPSALKLGLLYYTSEKYAYLPIFGLLLLDAIVLTVLLEKWPRSRTWLSAAAVVLLSLYAIRTFVYVPRWRSMEKYSTYILQSDPGNPHALSNLGLEAERRNDLDSAREYYERALKADPSDITHYLNAASLANKQGRKEDMRRIFRSLVPALNALQLHADSRLPRAIIIAAKEVVDPIDRQLALDLLGAVFTLVPDDPLVKELSAEVMK